MWYGPHDLTYPSTPTVVGTSDGALGAVWAAAAADGPIVTSAAVLAQKVGDSATEIVPHLDSVSPTTIEADTGVAAITVRGIHLGPFVDDATTRLLVNGVWADRQTWRDSWVNAKLPPALEGLVDVTVVTPRGTSNALQVTVTRPAPEEYGCTPSSGPVGTAVDLRGDYFGATQAGSSGTVEFRDSTTGNWVAAAITGWTYRHIYLTVPAGLPTGVAAVRVTTDKGIATGSNFNVTVAPQPPSIATLTPTSGAVGSPVQIDGANFGASKGASAVTFGGTTAATTGWADTRVTATVPAGLLPGPVAVTVTVGGVASGSVVFTVTAPSTPAPTPAPAPAPAPALASSRRHRGRPALPSSWAAAASALRRGRAPSGSAHSRRQLRRGATARSAARYLPAPRAPSPSPSRPPAGPRRP